MVQFNLLMAKMLLKMDSTVIWVAGSYWLECWTSNRKVARSNPRADKVKICRSAPEPGS